MSEQHAMFEVSQGAIIENTAGEILILQAQNDRWVIPGGHLHEGEDWLDGLKREVFEETGVQNIHVKKIFDVGVFGKSYGVSFHCKLNDDSQNIVLSDEHRDFAWVKSRDDAEKYSFHNAVLKNLVLKAIETL